jgi:hypothetical protein
MASPMLQEIFGASAAVAAGFTGLISLFKHRRSILLGVAVGPHRPQSDLRDILRAWYGALRGGAVAGAHGKQGCVRARRVRHRVDVRRRLRNHSAYLADTFGTAVRWRHTRPIADRVGPPPESSAPVLVNYIVKRSSPPAFRRQQV